MSARGGLSSAIGPMSVSRVLSIYLAKQADFSSGVPDEAGRVRLLVEPLDMALCIRSFLVVALMSSMGACARPRNDASSEFGAGGETRSTEPAAAFAHPEPPVRPKGFVQVRIGGVAATTRGSAVFLVDFDGKRAVPIFIGDTEALSIQRRLKKRELGAKSQRKNREETPRANPAKPSNIRPLTHDLLDTMLKQLGGEIHSVRVERLKDEIFYGIVVMRTHGSLIEFDARSSDAVALAVGNDVPIFMAQSVMDRAGLDLEEFLSPREEGNPETGHDPGLVNEASDELEPVPL
jgi:bifunctional DNase/RNase